jgi:hypothetical protein
VTAAAWCEPPPEWRSTKRRANPEAALVGEGDVNAYDIRLHEYWIHRDVFHFEPQGKVGARLRWMVPGVLHDHPTDPLRPVTPPAAP